MWTERGYITPWFCHRSDGTFASLQQRTISFYNNYTFLAVAQKRTNASTPLVANHRAGLAHDMAPKWTLVLQWPSLRTSWSFCFSKLAPDDGCFLKMVDGPPRSRYRTLLDFLIGFTTEASWPLPASREKKSQRSTTSTFNHLTAQSKPHDYRDSPSKHRGKKPRKIRVKDARTTTCCLYKSPITSPSLLLQPTLGGRQHETLQQLTCHKRENHR